MTTATRKAKADPAADAMPATPITFADIAKAKAREKLEAYRGIVQRRADGEVLSVADMERAAELLDQLGLPLFTFDRDAEAIRRFRQARDKYQAAADAVPENQRRAAELPEEIAAAKSRWLTLQEEYRLAMARVAKPAAYLSSVQMISLDHPHLLADLDEAAELRIAELDRRRRGGADQASEGSAA
jgi:hypothetical protein